MTRVLSPIPAQRRLDWVQKLRRLFIAPHASIKGSLEQGRAVLLATLSLVFLGSLLAALLFRPGSVSSFMILIAVVSVSYILSRTPYFNYGAFLFSFGLVLFPFISFLLGFSTDLGSSVLTFIPITLILAGSILSRRAYLLTGLLATLLAFLAPLFSGQPMDQSALRSGGLILTTAVILYSVNTYRQNLDRARLEEQQKQNRELQKLKNELETRVEERTHQLSLRTDELAQRSKDLQDLNVRLRQRSSQFEAISKVSRSIAAIRDLEALLPEVTATISQYFGFYHIGIFLLDETGRFAVLRAANSEGGQRMLVRSHRLEVGEQGIVGYVTGTGRPRIALDVGTDAVFFNNPDLPETHSEMALPLKSAERIIGALDVQSTQTNAFGEEDIELLSLLADQVSLAIENARLFDETQRSLAEAEAFSRQYLREGWGRLSRQQHMVGYRYDTTGAAPLTQPMQLAPHSSGEAAPIDMSQVNIPIELRGEVLGTLVVKAPTNKKWSQDELDLIKAVADRVALSAENARLFDETTRRAERERMVSEITSKIRSSNDPSEMIKLAVQELKSALGDNRVEVVPQRVPTHSK
jgi:GAF domain-containing protein